MALDLYSMFIQSMCYYSSTVVIICFLCDIRKTKPQGRYKGVRTAEEIDMNNVTQSKEINVTDLKQYCTQQHANTDQLFQIEYEVSPQV